MTMMMMMMMTYDGDDDGQRVHTAKFLCSRH